jgi:hypothetical protein
VRPSTRVLSRIRPPLLPLGDPVSAKEALPFLCNVTLRRTGCGGGGGGGGYGASHPTLKNSDSKFSTFDS